MLKNLPSNAGDVGSIPGQATNIPHALGQLSPNTTTREVGVLQQRPSTAKTKQNKTEKHLLNTYRSRDERTDSYVLLPTLQQSTTACLTHCAQL